MHADRLVRRLLAGVPLVAVYGLFGLLGWGPGRVLVSSALVAFCAWLTFLIILCGVEEVWASMPPSAVYGIGLVFSLYPLTVACWFAHLELTVVASATFGFYLVGLLANLGRAPFEAESPLKPLRSRRRPA